MKICIVTKQGDGIWFAYIMKQAGHEVTCVLRDKHFSLCLQGLVEVTDSAEDPSKYDLVVYDTTGFGKEADEVRKLTPVIGDSEFADVLEHDRVFGLEFMARCNIQTPPWEHFTDISEGIRYINKTKKRFVFKPCGDKADCSATYVSKSAEDLLKYIDVLYRSNPQGEFVLQEFKVGTEVSTEMWVNEKGYHAVNVTLETKKFMSGDIGPATGCSGSLVRMTNREPLVFKRGLKKAYDTLVESGYVGMIDLNAIVTSEGVFGLEWTPRFGYDATCNLTRVLPIDFGDFLYRVAANENMPDLSPKIPFCASIRVSIPPYPLFEPAKNIYRKGVPIGGLTPKMLNNFYACDLRCKETNEDEFETCGTDGMIGAAMGSGESPHQAFQSARDLIRSLSIPDCQWRNDVEEAVAKRYSELEKGGWFRSGYGDAE